MQITQDLNEIKKNPEHSFVDIGKWETCAKFRQKKYSTAENFKFLRQNAWSLKIGGALSKSLCGILHYLISITKL